MDDEAGRARLELYLESLEARMPRGQFALLMRVFRAWLAGGGGTLRMQLEPEEHELFTSEVQGELLTLMGLLGSLSPGREDRSDHVVVDLGGGDHTHHARTLVPRHIAEDPERLAELRRDLEAQERFRREQRERDLAEVEAIARISGMLPEE